MAAPIAFRPNESYDLDQASDGRSRYGAYLAQQRGMFLDFYDQPTTDLLEFAATAWEIAQPPIMSPGYVATHPRIQSAMPTWDEEHHLAVTVTVALGNVPALTQLSRARGWAHDRVSGSWYDPADCAVLTALGTATIRVPIRPGDLPVPEYRDRIPVTEVAKAAVAAVCCVLNPVLSAVLDD